MLGSSREHRRASTGTGKASTAFPKLVERFLQSRGLVSSEDVVRLLRASLGDMKDPFSLSGVHSAVARFEGALERSEKICVYGDFDLDGSSGLALTVDALKRMGFPEVMFYQPKRLSEGYGLHVEAVESFAKQGVKLIFTVDVGITAIEAAIRAKELGVDLIISDHHLPKETLPDAYAVINPNSGVCNSGLGYLCGAGVAFYTMLALRSHLKAKGLLAQDFNPKELLDLFVIGTLTDMVPLVGENRILSKHGLLQFKNSARPGLQVLMEKLGYAGKNLTGQDLAIGIAPKLNALSRLEMGLMPVDVLMADSREYAEEVIDRVLELNDKRKRLQAFAEKHAEESYLAKENSAFCFVWSEEYHQGILGLVATKIAQNYAVPAFVACCNEEGKMVGSARLPDNYEGALPDILSFCQESLMGFGGHAQAAGFHLHKENADSFYGKLESFFEEGFSPNQSSSDVAMEKFDCRAELSEVDSDLLDWLDQIGPYGQDFPVPSFHFCNLEIVKTQKLRGGHLKWKLQDVSRPQVSFDALYFSPPKSMAAYKETDRIDVVAEVQWNYFAGRRSIQLLLKSVQVSF